MYNLTRWLLDVSLHVPFTFRRLVIKKYVEIILGFPGLMLMYIYIY